MKLLKYITIKLCIKWLGNRNIKININEKNMINQNGNINLTEGPTCKKIQNYIFKFSDLLGQGNFSKVYKAHH